MEQKKDFTIRRAWEEEGATMQIGKMKSGPVLSALHLVAPFIPFF